MSASKSSAKRPPLSHEGGLHRLMWASIRIALVLLFLFAFAALKECGAGGTKPLTQASPDGRWVSEVTRFGNQGETFVALRAVAAPAPSPERLVLAERAAWAAVAWNSPTQLVVYLPRTDAERPSARLGDASVSFQAVSFDRFTWLEKLPEASLSQANGVRVHFAKKPPATRRGRLICELYVDGEAVGDLVKFRMTLRTTGDGPLASGMRFEAALSPDAQTKGIRVVAAQVSSSDFRSNLGDQSLRWNHSRSSYDRTTWVNSWIPSVEEQVLRLISEGRVTVSYAVVGPLKILTYRINFARSQSAIDAYRACSTEAFSGK